VNDADAQPSASIHRLTPGWQVNSRVTALCTSRLGGVSQSPYDALNLGLHVGDDAHHVLENRRLLKESLALPSSPHWLNQTHSAHVQRIDTADNSVFKADPDPHLPPPADTPRQIVTAADGAWTSQPDTVLAVLSADCLPVIISDTQGSAVAAIHAGWRGLAAGILENALALFDQHLPLHAWLGPAIGPQAFEVGEDVRQAFTQRCASHSNAFKQGLASDKYWCDLYALARAQLQQSRSITVTGGDYCTYRQSRLFHSYRRDGARSGRMATLVWIASKP